MEIERPKLSQPIPESAEKVFAGVLFDVYQWKQKMFDGSFCIFEKAKKTDTVNVIPIKDGKIVLTYQEQPGVEPFISVPGGRIDKGESALEAARRELLEETGLVSDKIKLWFSHQPFNKIDWAVYNFIAYDCRKAGEQNLDNGEKIRLMDATFDEFAKISAQDDFRNTEISLKFFQALSNGGLEKLREMFLG